jgi:pimeloyl-ACP methyl ester carboxylesterase
LTEGRLLVYFHGAPGSPEEADLFRASATANGLRVFCQDRFAIDASLDPEAYFPVLADDIIVQAKGQKIDVLGFSIGAFVALQVCRRIPAQVRSLHLVSPAAPLEGGNFLDGMAGKVVFQMARKTPWLFKLLSYWQGILARLAPGFLFFTLFASAQAADKTLSGNTSFRSQISEILVQCFRGGVAGYIRDVRAYVHPWHDDLQEIKVPTHLWHGEQDNWSPIAMSEYLRQQLPNVKSFTRMPRMSHYSCLYAAAPEICSALQPAAV